MVLMASNVLYSSLMVGVLRVVS